MKHNVQILLIIISLLAVTPSFAEEPNAPTNTAYSQFETRLKSLEERIIALEEKIQQLESRRPVPIPPRTPNPISDSQNDPNRDALRIERSTKKIKEARDAIDLDESRIQSLPEKIMLHKPFPYRLRPADVPEILRTLDTAKDNARLLNQQENNYKKILQIVEKNPDLKIDPIEAKRELIVCQGNGKKADQDLNRIQELIQFNRELFNIVPK